MAEDQKTGEEDISLEKPERGAKEGYLGMFYDSSRQMNRVIAESNGISDHRIRLLTLKMIAGITDDTIRAKAFLYFNDKIEEMRKSGKSADEINQDIANFCCGEMQGHIVSFYDQFLGITHRLKLGRV